MHNFRKMDIWLEARLLVKEIYLLTKSFPMQEQFGITSQIRRAAISIPSNIAEGLSKSSDKDFARFLERSIVSSLQSHQKKMYNFKKKLL